MKLHVHPLLLHAYMRGKNVGAVMHDDELVGTQPSEAARTMSEVLLTGWWNGICFTSQQTN